MADDEDLIALHSGSTDLIRRDFRNAQLIGASLEGRDFSSAYLQGTNFENANLRGSTFIHSFIFDLKLIGANLSSTKWYGAIGSVDFGNADLRDSRFEDCQLQNCNYEGANLRGANFTGSIFHEGNNFEGAIVDETTLFDGVQILRALARQNAFRFYEVDRGRLIRKEQQSAVEADALAGVSERKDLLEQTNALIAALHDFAPPVDNQPRGIGHNNPPEETPFERPEYDALMARLNELKVEIPKPHPEIGKIEAAFAAVTGAALRVLPWLARKFDLATDELAKEAGKMVPKLGMWALLGTGLYKLLERQSAALEAFLKALSSGG